MKVWTARGFKDMEIGTKVFVGRAAAGRSVFGEYATLTKVLAKHLVFTTESGATVKTGIDNLCDVKGKAFKAGYFVSDIIDRDFLRHSVALDIKYVK